MPDTTDATNVPEEGGPKKPAPRPRSGQITFVTGVQYRKKEKKLYITKRKLVFKNGLLVEVGETGPVEVIDVNDFVAKNARG